MPNKYAKIDEYQRIKRFILMKATRSITGRVDCSVHLVRPLSYADRDKLADELRDEGIVVEWVIQS